MIENDEHCCFCGRKIEGSSINNAEDFGLHKETTNQSCCDYCNILITRTNRCLSSVVKNLGDRSRVENNIKEAINNLEDFLEKYKQL